MSDHPERPDEAPGDVVDPETPSAGETICPDCGGSGRVGGEACHACEGTGRITEPVGGG